MTETIDTNISSTSEGENTPRGSAVIPAVAQPHSFVCLRSLGRRGVRTIAVCEQSTTPAFSSKYCDEKIIVPSPTDSLIEYKDALLTLARREDVRTIVPMREEDTYVLSKYRDEFAKHLIPLWPPFETLRIVHDRIRLVEAAERAGVPVPRTSSLDDTEQWDRRRIVKARYPLLTDDYIPSEPPEHYVSRNAVHYLERGTEPDREAIVDEMGHVPIVQEYIPGDEYALWALYDRGEPVMTCQKKQVRARSFAGGTSIYRVTTDQPALEKAGRALLDQLDWHGFASVQFKKDSKTGEFKLMEINPRTWISLSCPIQSGVDFPYYYWRLANGESVQPESNCETGVGTHNLAGEAMYLRSLLRDENPFVESPPLSAGIGAVLSSLYTNPHFEYTSYDDPGPFVRVVFNTLLSKAGIY
jgi:predicted ATP-grasp superfamily ATP-dependent carboligase